MYLRLFDWICSCFLVILKIRLVTQFGLAASRVGEAVAWTFSVYLFNTRNTPFRHVLVFVVGFKYYFINYMQCYYIITGLFCKIEQMRYYYTYYYIQR